VAIITAAPAYRARRPSFGGRRDRCDAAAPPSVQVADEIRALGRHAFAMPTDVTNASQLDALVKRTVSELGRIDILVNVAGGTPPMAAMGLTDEELEEAFHFNVTSVFHLSKACAPHMAKNGGGSIVNISSAMSHRVDSGFVAHGAAKQRSAT
jgi:7-alpha-hydroxysteroid dehydrogenase